MLYDSITDQILLLAVQQQGIVTEKSMKKLNKKLAEDYH